MPSYIEEPEAAACKWVSIREDNAKYEPAGGLLDPRLHASGDRLPARDLRRLAPHADAHGRVGGSLGEMARAQGLDGARDPRHRAASAKGRSPPATRSSPGSEVRVWSRTQESLDRFLAEEQPRYPHLELTAHDRRASRRSRGADVVVTGTHARGWIVDDAWIEPGTHLAALGADLEGEQELDPRILQRARVFVDDIRQCRDDGEINVPLREGLISEDDSPARSAR